MRRRVAGAVVVATLVAGTIAADDAPCSLPTERSATPVAASCGLELVGAVDVTDAGLGQVDLHGDLAAVVLRDEGKVALVDVGDPASPTVVGTYDGGTGQAALDHPLDGDVVFSADGALLFHARQTSDWSNEGLHVLDVSDPTHPVRVDLASQGGMLRVATAVVGGTELVATLDAIVGLTLFEVVRTPLGATVVPVYVDALPVLKVGGPASAGLAFDVAADGSALLVAGDGTEGLHVYDVTDPGDVAIVGGWDGQGLAAVAVEHRDGRRLVHAASEYWFDASTPPELITLDATDPGAVTEVARSNLGAYDGHVAWKLGGLAVADGALLAAHGHAGLAVVDPVDGGLRRATTDLGTPTLPHPTYGFLARYAMDVAVHDDRIVVTDAVTGELRLFERT